VTAFVVTAVGLSGEVAIAAANDIGSPPPLE